ncbi:MAG: lycopene cyclase domain-containing protein [Ignavibacteria bacterium]|nr:lycopene cyclase domain-containing protein [Ignavibacteria bacterium]
MTYLSFLLVFTIVPSLLLIITLWKTFTWDYIKVLLFVSFIAFSATSLWDNYAVYSGIWFFPEEKTLHIKLFYVPIEEYMFFFLQTYTTGLFQLLYMKFYRKVKNGESSKISFFSLPMIFLFMLEVIKLPFGKFNYLFHLLTWAGFFIFIQYLFGRKKIFKYKNFIFFPAIIMTLYFSLCDSISIGHGIWDFDPEQTIGTLVYNVPLEEIIFFLCTNLLITEAMILFLPERFLSYFKK